MSETAEKARLQRRFENSFRINFPSVKKILKVLLINKHSMRTEKCGSLGYFLSDVFIAECCQNVLNDEW